MPPAWRQIKRRNVCEYLTLLIVATPTRYLALQQKRISRMIYAHDQIFLELFALQGLHNIHTGNYLVNGLSFLFFLY